MRAISSICIVCGRHLSCFRKREENASSISTELNYYHRIPKWNQDLLFSFLLTYIGLFMLWNAFASN